LKNNTSLYVFRHGETKASKEGRPYGKKNKTAKLLPEGITAIEDLGEYLATKQIEQYYTSEYLRCIETSKLVSQFTGLPSLPDSRLNEFVEGSLEVLLTRLESFLKDIDTGGTVGICTHGSIITALIYIYQGLEVREENLYTYPRPGELTIFTEGQIDIVSFRSD